MMRTLLRFHVQAFSALAAVIATLSMSASHAESSGSLHAQRTASVLSPVMAWRASWSALASYEADDMVSRAGVTYVATRASIGVDPALGGQAWRSLADPGAAGPVGDTGAPGIPGATGARGGTGAVGPVGLRGATGLDGLVGPIVLGTTGTLSVPVFGIAASNTTGHAVLLTVRGGVAAGPGDSGRIYLQIAPNVNGSPGAWTSMDYEDCAQLASGTGQIGCGGTLSALLPPGAFYRLTTQTLSGAPAFVTDGGVAASFQTLD